MFGMNLGGIPGRYGSRVRGRDRADRAGFPASFSLSPVQARPTGCSTVASSPRLATCEKSRTDSCCPTNRTRFVGDLSTGCVDDGWTMASLERLECIGGGWRRSGDMDANARARSFRSDVADHRRHRHHPARGVHRRTDRHAPDTPVGAGARSGSSVTAPGCWWHPSADLLDVAPSERLLVRRVTLSGATSGIPYVMAEALVAPDRLPELDRSRAAAARRVARAPARTRADWRPAASSWASALCEGAPAGYHLGARSSTRLLRRTYVIALGGRSVGCHQRVDLPRTPRCCDTGRWRPTSSSTSDGWPRQPHATVRSAHRAAWVDVS